LLNTKSKNVVMKKLLSIALLVLCCLGVSSFIYEDRECNQLEQNKEQVVYVCTGGSATKYHSHSNCRGLNRCKGKVVSMPISNAKEQGKTPCKICFKAS
jgi:hypothetical protein